MHLQGKKVAILVEEMFNLFEFWYPYYRLKEAGAEVVVIGSGRTKEFNGKPCTVAVADAAAEDVQGSDFDGVIIPGGYAPDMMRRFPAMIRLVKDADAAGKVVAAICHAGWLLISADIVKNRKATSYFAIKDDMVNAGALWQDEAVVIDNNLITSRNPDDMPLFLPAIIKALQ
jgi:protease I